MNEDDQVIVDRESLRKHAERRRRDASPDGRAWSEAVLRVLDAFDVMELEVDQLRRANRASAEQQKFRPTRSEDASQ